MQALFDYVQSGVRQDRPLVLAGFESQHTGVKAKTELFVDFERFLKQRDPKMIDKDWKLFKRLSLSTFASRAYRPEEGEKDIFFRKLQTLKQALGKGESGGSSLMGSAGFWYQVVGSIESQALRYWQMTVGNEVSVRDLQMAINLIWLAEIAYPGKKIIVWAHNGHIAKNISGLGPVSAQASGPDSTKAPKNADAFVPMGYTIHSYFGPRAYCIGFSGSEGSYMDYVDSHIISVPPKPGNSIEGMLASAGYSYAFMNYHHAPVALQQKQQASLGDYTDLKGIWPDTFDGLFFIKSVFPVERL
jgi:erythromycin esterase